MGKQLLTWIFALSVVPRTISARSERTTLEAKLYTSFFSFQAFLANVESHETPTAVAITLQRPIPGIAPELLQLSAWAVVASPCSSLTGKGNGLAIALLGPRLLV